MCEFYFFFSKYAKYNVFFKKVICTWFYFLKSLIIFSDAPRNTRVYLDYLDICITWSVIIYTSYALFLKSKRHFYNYVRIIVFAYNSSSVFTSMVFQVFYNWFLYAFLIIVWSYIYILLVFIIFRHFPL